MNSGIGQTYWQVILGRIVAGCGASGMVSLASIIITGEFAILFSKIAVPTDYFKQSSPTLRTSRFYEVTST